MSSLARLAFLAAIVTTGTASAQDTAPPAADTFEREALATLRQSHANKRGIVLHVGGQRIAGIVKAIGPDVVVVANQEHARIVVRRERIDAIEAD